MARSESEENKTVVRKGSASARRANAQATRAKREREQMMLIGGIIVVVSTIFVVLILLATQAGSRGAVKQGNYAALRHATTSDGAPILGDPTANIVLVEFADFSCPHCLEYHETIQSVIDKYVRTGQARLIARLMTFVGREYSDTAAVAALCAIPQNGFWDMYDALFNIQAQSGPYGFTAQRMTETASQLSMDAAKIQRCMANRDVSQTLQVSEQLFQQYKLEGVPGMLISTDGGLTFRLFKSGETDVAIPTLDIIDLNMRQALASNQ